MGSSPQRSLDQRNTTLGVAEGCNVSQMDVSNGKAIQSVTSPAARGSRLRNQLDIDGKLHFPIPTESHENTQAQHPVPCHAEAGILGHPVFISSCGDHPTGHRGHGSSINNVACAIEKIRFPVCWEPGGTPTAETTSMEAPTRMGNHDVGQLELCYQRVLGVDNQLQCHESDDEGMLMMKSSNTTLKAEAEATGIGNDTAVVSCAADLPLQGHFEHRDHPKALPQTIPQFHAQAVTPPDSKLAPHVTQNAITTGRPSPAPPLIASRQIHSPIVLTTSNKLPQNAGFATPEYTLPSHGFFNPPNPGSSLLRSIRRDAGEEERGFAPKLESFIDWPGNPSLPKFSEKVTSRAQPKVSNDYVCHERRNTSPDSQISESFLQALIPSPVPLGRELTNPKHSTLQYIDYPRAEAGQATLDPRADTVVVCGFDCPSENYIHKHFTQEAQRHKWEVSQSYKQWPQMKARNRNRPATRFDKLEQDLIRLIEQLQVHG